MIQAILNFLGLSKKPVLSPKYNPPPREFRNLRVLKKAASKLGTKEWRNGSNPEVEEFHRYASQDNNESMKDDVPWCSSFLCWVTETVGMGSTNSRAARSWLQWGISVRRAPIPGDIIVFYRGPRKGWMGHVGIFLRETQSYFYVLGGNQNDSVNITRYTKEKVLDIRRSSLHRKLTKQELIDLKVLAENLISHGQIEPPGSQE